MMNYYINTDNFKIKKDTGWIQLNNVIRYRIVDNIVYVRGYSDGGVNIGGSDYVNVGTLPEECRPAYIIMFAWSPYGQLSGNPSARIDPDGSILMYNSTASTAYWGFIISYPV